ncbi:LytTR family DNA-binding domain-containing protein [Cohnella lupini]|uniref:LytTr DNA-binding domain-containing protein n=1 Tax=Cohnella lupini TaxID=1294267 RepID=A0A3D9I6M6_9BACL|nr:LytTR family DNA-binding domain-containing protein [Cohnella lupini]RED57179.1 LytTr DNA-binding domain-containing protein [Cohnella lupini]
MHLPLIWREKNSDFEIVHVDPRDILYIYVEGGSLRYQTADRTYTQITTLDEQERYLRDQGFVRTERGYLANIDAVTWYDPAFGRLQFGKTSDDVALSVPVSRAKSGAVRALNLREVPPVRFGRYAYI